MKIVAIFASTLYAIQYENEEQNEFDRLMDLWTDVTYLRNYAVAQKISDKRERAELVNDILEDAEYLDDFMCEAEAGRIRLSNFFQSLNNLESCFKILSLQKGKLKKSYLRLYAIRIDTEVYLITGGAIKLVYLMQESEELMHELNKLKYIKDFLNGNGVFDKDSFEEYLKEENE